MDQRPIGIFDSGLGGLTVVKEVMEELSNENIVYFGDTARIPYGSKSKDTVIKFSRQIIRFLLTQDVKAIIIACNTASAAALKVVQKEFDIPIIGVVEPGAKMAAQMSTEAKIGIIATETTVRSEAYNNHILKIRPEAELYAKPCPLLVPLVEQGWIQHTVTDLVLQEYLGFVKEKNIDSLVLGCTHYPLLAEVIQKVVGPKVQLINPAKETAVEMKKILESSNQLNVTTEPRYSYFLSDNPESFETLGSQFLQRPVTGATTINIEMY